MKTKCIGCGKLVECETEDAVCNECLREVIDCDLISG